MEALGLLAGMGLLIMFVSIGASISYRIIKNNGPIITQTSIRTTHIHRQQDSEK